MDTQKETYRKYLESAGVIDALTKGAHAAQQDEMLSICPAGQQWCLAYLVVFLARVGRRQMALANIPLESAYQAQSRAIPCHVHNCCASSVPAVLVSLYEEPDKPKSAIE
jgi:hypothetical protein